MQKDKQIEELLRTWGAEETSAGFTNNVMNKIEAAYAPNKFKQPLLHNKLKYIFIAAFLLLAFTLSVLSAFINPVDIPFKFSISLPIAGKQLFINIISFLIAFWLVMIVNYKVSKFKSISDV